VPEAADKAPQTPVNTDPFRNYNFKLDIMGITEGHFTECSSIGMKVQALRYREGGVQQVERRLPGRTEYTDITLRFGMTASDKLWRWFSKVAAGKLERKNISIILIGDDGTTEVMRWNLLNAWPSGWQVTPLDALGNEVVIVALTLVFDSLQQA
jgi:phage tail-like protein